MNKRLRILIVSLLLLSLLVSTFGIPAFASEPEDDILISRSVVYHDDGSWDEIVVNCFPASRSVMQITGSVSKKHYDSSNQLVWKVKLTGTFQYDGTSSVCTNAYTTVNLYQSGWTVISENTTHSGNTAHSVVTLGMYVGGALMTAGYSNLSLSCDKNGNLS